MPTDLASQLAAFGHARRDGLWTAASLQGVQQEALALWQKLS